MKKMFITGHYCTDNQPIREVVIIKESDFNYWYKTEKGNENRERKSSRWMDWHETNEQAKSFLIKKAQFRIRLCKKNLNNAETELTKLMEALSGLNKIT